MLPPYLEDPDDCESFMNCVRFLAKHCGFQAQDVDDIVTECYLEAVRLNKESITRSYIIYIFNKVRGRLWARGKVECSETELGEEFKHTPDGDYETPFDVVAQTEVDFEEKVEPTDKPDDLNPLVKRILLRDQIKSEFGHKFDQELDAYLDWLKSQPNDLVITKSDIARGLGITRQRLEYYAQRGTNGHKA